MIRRKGKPHEPREVKKIKNIKWIAIGEDDFKAEDGDYLLRVEQMNIRNWWYSVSFQNHEIASSSLSTHKDSMQKAKSAAMHQMNKHKKSLIRKNINSCP